jgi:hypothetical protein
MERNAHQVNQVVRYYQGQKRKLMVLSGIRKVVPVDAYPVFEIEPDSSPNRWATTRAQRPRHQFKCVLTVNVDREEFGVEYICTLASSIVEIMTSPENLQMRILNETHWDPNGGLVETYILDSLVDSVRYVAMKEGAVRKAEFSWFAEIHEPYPESKWIIGSEGATVIRPLIVTQ